MKKVNIKKSIIIFIGLLLLIILLLFGYMKYDGYKLDKFISTDWEPIKTEELEKNISIDKKHYVDSIRENSRKTTVEKEQKQNNKSS